MDPKTFIRDKFAGNPNANRPLSEHGREGAEARRLVRYDAYKNIYNADIRMYPELAKAPTVTANVAAAAVQAAEAVPTAQTYPLPEQSAATPKGSSDKFAMPTDDYASEVQRRADELMRQNAELSHD